MKLPPEIPSDVLSFALPPGTKDAVIESETTMNEAAVVARAELRKAADLRKPIDRAVRWAQYNAWGLAVMGVLSVPGMFGSVSGFLVVVGLGACAFLEFRGRAALRRLEPAGAKLLANNQLLLAAVILTYCGLTIAGSLTGHGYYDKLVADNPEVADALGGFAQMMKHLEIGVYLVVAVLGAGFQVLAWRFHLARVKMVEAYRRETPAWVLEDAGERAAA